MPAKATKKTAEMSLEAMLQRLDEISVNLDSDLPLEKALELYEEGVGLIKSANKLITQAEAKIKTLDLSKLDGEEKDDEQ